MNCLKGFVSMMAAGASVGGGGKGIVGGGLGFCAIGTRGKAESLSSGVCGGDGEAVSSVDVALDGVLA